MTLTVYLAQRGKKAKALTKIEAQVFGIPFPLQAGWPRRHGAMEITAEMIDQVAQRAAADAASTEKVVRRSAKRAAAAQKPSKPQAAESTTASSCSSLDMFPGFALRPARRYRRSKSVRVMKKARR
ncbi:hypothetical protein [Massilia sp. TN1-12]|uniref:hypothetical protein n=1 Tax=Massilia paldalensis TaxID=3377675 RepID=UPI00384F1652